MKKIVFMLAALVGLVNTQHSEAIVPIVAAPVMIQVARVIVQVGVPALVAHVSHLLADTASLEEGKVKDALTTVPAAIALVATTVMTGTTSVV